MKYLFSDLKNFFDEYYRRYIKFWLNQFVMSMLGLMITIPAAALATQNPSLGSLPYLIAAVFCGGFFCFLVYDSMFQLGAREFIKIENKTMKYEPLKGLKISLTAYFPTIVIVLFAIIFNVFGLGNAYAVTSVILNIVIHAQYSGLFYVMPDSLVPLTLIISLIPALVFGFLGYYLPVNNKTLRGLFGLKVKNYRE